MLGVSRVVIISMTFFVVGVIFGMVLSTGSYESKVFEKTLGNQNNSENISPSDRLKERDIRLYSKRVIIEIDGPILAGFTDTKSMEPVINKDSNAIEVVPKNVDKINVGDIISYNSNFSEGPIIHRVVEKGYDEKGLYFRTKGDNLPYIDPEKIRKEQVLRVVVGILY